MPEQSAAELFDAASSFYVPVATSTMDEARIVSDGRPCGLVRAGRQTAGRGRLPGRAWHDQANDSLLVTYWLPSESFCGAPPPLLAGLAVRSAVQSWASSVGASFRQGIELKWPNDVICGGRKLAGLLCESSGATVYVGIGVNCGQQGFAKDYRTEPASLFLETGARPEPAELLGYLTRALRAVVQRAGSWRPEYESCLAWRGQRVKFKPGLDGEAVEGILEGVDATGALLVSGHAWSSGELSRRY